MPLVMNPNQIRENTLEDADGDTKIEVEATADEDKIRFHTSNVQRMIIDETGRVGISSANPISELDVSGKIAITAEVATPIAPTDGKGWLYTKNDGKLYWQSFDVSETDLTSGGAGGGISSVVGTNNEVEAVNNSGNVTVGLPTNITIQGTVFSGFYDTNGTLIIRAYGAETQAEKERSFTYKKHINISTTNAGWQDIISWRPKVTGTGADPGNNTLWGAMSGQINLSGHCNGVGNSHRRMEFVVFYNGSDASSADGYNNDTSGTVLDFRVNRSGWVTTLQFQRTGSITAFHGFAAVTLHFGRGAGANGDNIYWEVT